jgi:hypothetical protein
MYISDDPYSDIISSVISYYDKNWLFHERLIIVCRLFVYQRIWGEVRHVLIPVNDIFKRRPRRKRIVPSSYLFEFLTSMSWRCGQFYREKGNMYKYIIVLRGKQTILWYRLILINSDKHFDGNFPARERTYPTPHSYIICWIYVISHCHVFLGKTIDYGRSFISCQFSIK